MIESITAKENKKLKLISSLSAKKGRIKNNAYLVEGKRMVLEAFEYVRDAIMFIIISENFSSENKDLVTSLDESAISVYTVSDKLFKESVDTMNPQGIAAAVSIKNLSVKKSELNDINKILILDGISEPGNLGTIIRTAEAAGIELIYLLKGCADIYNPKVVRSTMGSIFRTEFVFADNAEILNDVKKHGFKIICSCLENSVDIYRYSADRGADESIKTAIVVGSEAFGVSEEVLNMSDIRVRIPMRGKVESLNAAIAAGILMYLL